MESMENMEKLFELLDSKEYHTLIALLADTNPVDVAEFINEVPEEKLFLVYRMLKKDTAAEVFAELDPEKQEAIIGAVNDKELSYLIEELFADDAVDMLEELPSNVVKRILKTATPETRNQLNQLLQYPDESAGSIMTSEYVDLKKDMTVEEAVAHIRKTGFDKETVYVEYVTNAERVLEGVVTLKELLFADPDKKISEIMDDGVIYGSTLDDRENIAAKISKYGFLALPIVDKENRLVGIVTVDDAIDVLENEATEDIQKMAAITPTEKPYMKTGVFETFAKRIPWLLLLMVSATFTGGIISKFEASLALIPILTSFIPMIMDTGGNSGGQASVTIIRGLALGEIKLKDILLIIWKEIRVALLCGTAIAICNFAKMMLFDRLVLGMDIDVTIALIVCLTLIVTIAIAKIVGCTLPIIAKSLKFDPAIMASPFITTIVDAISLIVYFNIAKMILHI